MRSGLTIEFNQAPRASRRLLPEFGGIWQLLVLLHTLLVTLALWTLAQAPPGIQHLLLLCLLRLSVLLCVGAVTHQSHRRRRSEDPSPFAATSLTATPPRTSLTQAALYLQLSWLAFEVVLAAGLLLFYPQFAGNLTGSSVVGTSIGTLLTLLPLLCALVMSGCFLILQRLSRRCRQQTSGAADSPRLALECGGGSGYAAVPHQRQTVHQMHAHAHAHSASMDVICSPLSEDGSYSSCTSSGTSAAFYSRSSSSSVLGLNTAGSCGGVPSPTSHVRRGGSAAAADHEAAIHAACQILLVEHHVASLVDTNDCVMFVHKKLRPIKTRPEDPNLKQPPKQPGLLRGLISDSFTFQKADPQRGGGSACVSAATSVTFQTAAAAAAGLVVM